MTKYINLEDKIKVIKKTVFTHYFSPISRLDNTPIKLENCDEIVYLGKCNTDGDIFACYIRGSICIYKGKKGDEF
jgi:hypothetical protein